MCRGRMIAGKQTATALHLSAPSSSLRTASRPRCHGGVERSRGRCLLHLHRYKCQIGARSPVNDQPAVPELLPLGPRLRHPRPFLVDSLDNTQCGMNLRQREMAELSRNLLGNKARLVIHRDSAYRHARTGDAGASSVDPGMALDETPICVEAGTAFVVSALHDTSSATRVSPRSSNPPLPCSRSSDGQSQSTSEQVRRRKKYSRSCGGEARVTPAFG